MVRLVKGAYWDSEIKRAQVDGLDGYPVYTRKAYTDVAYLACARRLLAAPDAVFPQFATHNAHTLAAIYHLAGGDAYAPDQYEFQCLHGMGEPLYEQVVGPIAQGKLDRPCRIYAPVGTHETLLAYLVRRLLENGANTSFVNRIADAVGADRRARRGSGDDGRTDRRHASRHRRHAARARPAASGDRVAGRDLRRGATQFARPRSRRRGPARRTGRRAAREPRRGVDGSAAAGERPPRWVRQRARVRAIGHAGTSGAQSCRPRRRRRPRPRGDARRCRARARERRRRRVRLGRDCGGGSRRDARARRRRARGRPAAPARAARARGRQDLSERHRRSARGGRLPALLRRAGAPRPGRRRRRAARPGRLHQPVELPARDLHRPGRRGARRRQPGARQARRADAADRRRHGAAPAPRRRADVGAAAAARPRRDGRCRAGRRRARPGRHVHRLDRRRAAAAEEPRRAPERRRPRRCR